MKLPRAWEAGIDAIESDELADGFAAAVSLAGAAILRARAEGCAARWKRDGSPVTVADERAEAILTDALLRLLPDCPIVAEEAASAGRLPATGRRFLLVDPLDGTREFTSGTDEFCVNVALIEDNLPTIAALYGPAGGRLYLAGAGARAMRLEAGRSPAHATDRRTLPGPAPTRLAPVALVSRLHRDAETTRFLARSPNVVCREAGSALKFALLAEGEADFYPRFGPTMEWDVAAGDALLRAVGGIIADPTGQPLAYGKPGFRTGPFVAWRVAAGRGRADQAVEGGLTSGA